MNLNNSIGFQFYVGWREVTNVYREVLGKDTTPQKVWVMELCQAAKEEGRILYMHQLSQSLCLDASAVSTLVGRMEKAGLVQRTHDLVDRRAVRVSITPEGTKSLQQLQNKLDELEARLDQGVKPSALKAVQGVVKQLQDSSELKQAA